MGFKRTNLLKSELQIRINIPSIGKALNFFLDLQSNQITIVVFIEAINIVQKIIDCRNFILFDCLMSCTRCSTKYDVQCHMVLYVTMDPFRMTLSYE